MFQAAVVWHWCSSMSFLRWPWALEPTQGERGEHSPPNVQSSPALVSLYISTKVYTIYIYYIVSWLHVYHSGTRHFIWCSDIPDGISNITIWQFRANRCLEVMHIVLFHLLLGSNASPQGPWVICSFLWDRPTWCYDGLGKRHLSVALSSACTRFGFAKLAPEPLSEVPWFHGWLWWGVIAINGLARFWWCILASNDVSWFWLPNGWGRTFERTDPRTAVQWAQWHVDLALLGLWLVWEFVAGIKLGL